MQVIVAKLMSTHAQLELSDGVYVTVARGALPADVHEGDVLDKVQGVYTKNEEQTACRKSRLSALAKKLCD